jgi:hypothetical protein
MNRTTTRTTQLLAGCAVSLALVGPALALNPQPLPRGRYLPYLPRTGVPAFRLGHPVRLPHCHGVQIGDPRTHPPVRVCD